jgi:glycosyltransferase involved in cell wall biosynthesis
MATEYASQMPYELRVFSHDARSAAATRNLGATQARGQTLLFIDDDVIAEPTLVQAHLQAQAPNTVILGYSKPVLPDNPSWYQRDARRWWEDTFYELGKPSHRFTYRDFFSGNMSLPAKLFHSVGGFDISFSGRLEDYELGLRLLKAGARFQFVPAAIGMHYDGTTLLTWVRRLRQEGVADIQIGQRHPEVRAMMFTNFEHTGGRWGRRLRRLAFAHPLRGAKLERFLLWLANTCERFHMRPLWRRIVGLLRKYNYWRGVAAAIEEQRALSAWLQEVPLPPAVAVHAPTLDVSALPSQEVLQVILERATELGLQVTLAGSEILALPPHPGAEPLRLEHIRGALSKLAQQQFVPALALHMARTNKGASIC